MERRFTAGIGSIEGTRQRKNWNLQNEPNCAMLDKDKDFRTEGDKFMNIPELSMALSQTKALRDVGVAVLSKTMDTALEQGSAMASMIDSSAMELSVNPDIGANIDISV